MVKLRAFGRGQKDYLGKICSDKESMATRMPATINGSREMIDVTRPSIELHATFVITDALSSTLPAVFVFCRNIIKPFVHLSDTN